ncbi:MAG: class I SAM-dependent methyltransferase [Deferribacteraceae bacterium]|jgi:SAM-dependent methyltransferase|nr:class I SAM-dependent methyltransferase [Deferribacteraceae bacterium]
MQDKEYWELRSQSFPTFLDGESYQKKMLKIMEENGIDFNGADVLDVGAGTGAYTINIAKSAKSVTALDISRGMLDALKQSADRFGLTNIEYVESDWGDYTPEKKFDIILCSLTPALKGAAAAEKVYDYVKKWGIQIGSAAPMKAYMLDGLFELHNIEGRYKKILHTEMKDTLKRRNTPFISIPVQGEWERTYSRDALIDNLKGVVLSHGRQPDIKAIEGYIERFKDEKSNLYISKTFYDVELMIWKGQEKS